MSEHRQLTGAKQDASPHSPIVGEAGVREFLAFALAEEHYALPLSSVREIMKLPAVTEVPRGPSDVLGIISVRGQVVTVYDLRKRMKLPERELGARVRVLLVSRGDEQVGLLVDRVLQVYRLREDEVEMASVMGGDLSECVMGIGRPGLNRPATAEEDEEQDSNRSGPNADEQANILILLDPIALLKR